ncbi:hypothetical protein CRG98_048474 [Punica granatum]|uniref:Uncharacterized protein n=1 Tax=Punica granatum TaxID=22663 RepID=A0A2I0HHH6_PUNGR|nr:hypothetical protein CRG98_048474 [Punica granatum]
MSPCPPSGACDGTTLLSPSNLRGSMSPSMSRGFSTRPSLHEKGPMSPSFKLVAQGVLHTSMGPTSPSPKLRDGSLGQGLVCRGSQQAPHNSREESSPSSRPGFDGPHSYKG